MLNVVHDNTYYIYIYIIFLQYRMMNNTLYLYRLLTAYIFLLLKLCNGNS